MLKKSLLIGSAVLLASAPLLVAEEKRDIFAWGDGIPGEQKVTYTQEASASVTWAGSNTGVGVSFINSNQTPSLRMSLFSPSSWNNSGALTALKEGTGLEKDSFLGFDTGLNYAAIPSGGRGPEIILTGFTSGQKYQVTVLIENGTGASNPNLTLRTTRAHNMSGLECYYGLLSGTGWDAETTGTVTFDTKGGEYLVTYTFTAGDGAALDLMTGSTAVGAPNMGIGMIAISTIPEPSAFGLLAGLGAIALTVSRRRRK